MNVNVVDPSKGRLTDPEDVWISYNDKKKRKTIAPAGPPPVVVGDQHELYGCCHDDEEASTAGDHFMTNNVCGITTWVRGSSVSDPQGMYYFSF